VFIVLGNRSLAEYPQGGGHWSWFLQYPLGLRALGHRVFWLEVLRSTGDRDRDAELARNFLARIAAYGLERDCAVVAVTDHAVQDLGAARIFGRTRGQIEQVARDADLLWNAACSVRRPLLSMFARRLFIDVDPGHLQILSEQFNLETADHNWHLSVGANVADADCEMPTLGVKWRPFSPFVYLPMWEFSPAPGADAPFTSVTQWTWEELQYRGRTLSASKRLAYMRYLDLPIRARRPFELAANVGAKDPVGDRDTLGTWGWRVVDPHEAVATPETYRDYLRASRAEILCPKPLYRELKTGWVSDRSVGYMALGRPVLAEDTGFSRHLPTGRGLLTFRDSKEAIEGVAEIDGNYPMHSRAAREMACDLFSSERQLNAMIAACE
jgi:hypothetical protein